MHTIAVAYVVRSTWFAKSNDEHSFAFKSIQRFKEVSTYIIDWHII